MRPLHPILSLATAMLLLGGCPSDRCEELDPQAQIDINFAGIANLETLEVGLVVNEGAWAGRKTFSARNVTSVTFVFQLRDHDRPPHKLTVNVDGLDRHGRTVARKSLPFYFKSSGCNWFVLDLGAITPADFGPDIKRDAARKDGLKGEGGVKKDGLKGEGGIKKDGLKSEGGIKKDGLKTEGGIKKDGPKTEGGIKKDGTKVDAPAPDATKPDAAKPDAPKPDAPKPDAPAAADLPKGEQPCDCQIGGTCYTSGATVGPCQTCVPTTSSTAPTWSTSCVATVAGTGSAGKADGAAQSASFNYPMGLFVDAATIYVADTTNNLIRTIKNGQVATLIQAGSLDAPQGLTLFNGKLYVADTGHHCIQEVTLGTTPTLASIAGTCTASGSADGPGATARFNGPDDILGRTSTGTLLVSDRINNAIRELTWDGSVWVVSTLPESNCSLATPSGLALKASTPERLFVSEWNGHVVRFTDAPFGTFTTLAGQVGAPGMVDGATALSKLNYPRDISLDALTGDLYIADSSNHAIRRVTSTGTLSTLAGAMPASPGFLDGAIATAQFNEPRGLFVYRHATASGGTQLVVYVADTANHRVRVIVP